MKKVFKNAVLFTTILFTGAIALFAKPKLSVSTEVASIDKHGNLNLALQSSTFYAKGFGVSDIVTVKLGKKISFDAPVGKNYSDVDKGAYILRINKDEVSLAINMGNIFETTGAAVGTPVTISLKESRGYLITYQKRILNTSNNREDFASDEIFANFREVKLGNIAPGRLYRSSSPINTESRAPYALKLMKQANPNLVLNLADHKSSAHLITDEYYSKLVQEGKVVFLNVNATLTDKKAVAAIKDGLIAMSENKGPYLIHGKEGKLRTGFVIDILGGLCGATIEEISADYMKSYENYNGVKPGTSQYETIAQVLPTLFEKLDGQNANNDNLQQVIENYLEKNIGLTRAQIENLRKNLQ